MEPTVFSVWAFTWSLFGEFFGRGGLFYFLDLGAVVLLVYYLFFEKELERKRTWKAWGKRKYEQNVFKFKRLF